MSEYDYLFKVIVVGDGAVGKTAITIRFAEGRFEEHYKMTIGVDFAIKLIEISGYRVKLQVWDTGGQERFSYIRPLYYKGAMAALAIFDLTNRESYDNLGKWFSEVADNCGAIPLMLVGNKSDLPDRAVESSEALALASKMGISYFEASAKNGRNINLLFLKLGELLLQAKIPALAAAPAVIETPTTPISADITPPPTIPTISPPPTVPTISAPPKPPTIAPPTIPTITTPTSDSTPSLDEALKILEGTEDITPEPTPESIDLTTPPPEPIEITPPMPEPIEIELPTPVELTPPPPTPAEITPPIIKPVEMVPPKPIDTSPPIPKPIDLTPPTPKPIDITPPVKTTPPIDIKPPIPEPAPLETKPPVPETPTSFIPFSSASSTPSTSSKSTDSRSIFVPFTLGGPTTTPRPSTPSSSSGGTWIDFMKNAPKVEEKTTSFIPFMTTISSEEPEEIVLEVVPKEKEEKEIKEIICPGCSRKISTAWKFCTYCGANLG